MKPPYDLFELTRVVIEDLLEGLDEEAFQSQGRRLRRTCVSALRSARRRLEARLA